MIDKLGKTPKSNEK